MGGDVPTVPGVVYSCRDGDWSRLGLFGKRRF